MKTYSSFTQAYYELLNDVYHNPEFVVAPRGMIIKEKLGVSFKITNPLNRIPQLKERNFSSSYFIAETLYYLSGNETTSWISYYSKFWDAISENGLANSAYGARIFKSHARVVGDENSHGWTPGWTQWQYVIDELKKDNDSRRAVIHIRSPWDSLLAEKDVPCTIAMQFFIRDNNLHLIVTMRSNDAVLGLANDVPAFTMFQELMALDLSLALGRPIGLGEYVHQANSLHIYERHFEMVEKILSNSTNRAMARAELAEPMPAMPGRPPLDFLLEFENVVRSATSVSEFKHYLHAADLKPYYRDWCLLLAAHRAKKLAYEIDQSSDFEAKLTYRGYSYK